MGPIGCSSKLELGHHAEVPAPAPGAPEQLGVLGLRGRQRAPVRGDDLHRAQAVAGEAQLSLQPARAAAQGEAADARGRVPATGHREAVLLGGGVDVAPERSALHPGEACLRIDLDPVHGAQIDANAPLADRVAGDAVAPAVHGQGQPLGAREIDRGGHVAGACAARDHRRPAVDHPVEHPPQLVVALIIRADELSFEPSLKRLQVCGRHCSPFRTSCSGQTLANYVSPPWAGSRRDWRSWGWCCREPFAPPPGGRVQVRPGQGERRRRLRLRPPSNGRRRGPGAGQGRRRAHGRAGLRGRAPHRARDPRLAEAGAGGARPRHRLGQGARPGQLLPGLQQDARR